MLNRNREHHHKESESGDSEYENIIIEIKNSKGELKNRKDNAMKTAS